MMRGASSDAGFCSLGQLLNARTCNRCKDCSGDDTRKIGTLSDGEVVVVRSDNVPSNNWGATRCIAEPLIGRENLASDRRCGCRVTDLQDGPVARTGAEGALRQYFRPSEAGWNRNSKERCRSKDDSLCRSTATGRIRIEPLHTRCPIRSRNLRQLIGRCGQNCYGLYGKNGPLDGCMPGIACRRHCSRSKRGNRVVQIS